MGVDLGRLLEAEQTFAARVDAARQQARALVESARQEAVALATDSGEALGQALRRLAGEEERALAAELSRLEAETATRVERLGRIDEARVVTLADQVLRALLEGGPG
jgi:vacuolar-type H+-ATPase subunit H